MASGWLPIAIFGPPSSTTTATLTKIGPAVFQMRAESLSMYSYATMYRRNVITFKYEWMEQMVDAFLPSATPKMETDSIIVTM